MSTRQRPCEAKDKAHCPIHGDKISPASYLPNYAKTVEKSENLYSALLSTHSANEVRKLNDLYEQNRLDLDASEEGMTSLMDEIEESAKQGLRPYAAEQRLGKARERRALLRADIAIKDFNAIEEHQYTAQAVKRLFAESAVTVTDMPGGHVLLGDKLYSYNSPAERAEIVAARSAQAETEARSYRYTAQALTKEITTLPRTRLVPSADRTKAIVYGPRGAYMSVEFDPETREIVRATVAHRSGDGSLQPLTGTVAIRKHLHAVDSGEVTSRPLPSWIVGTPAPAQAAALSVATDRLF